MSPARQLGLVSGLMEWGKKAQQHVENAEEIDAAAWKHEEEIGCVKTIAECMIMNSMSEVCSLECCPEYAFFGEHKLNAIWEAG